MANSMFFANRTKAICFSVMLLLAVASVSSADTIVRFETVLGDFDVQLYDTAAPITVANFLNYVNNGRFDNSLFHRLIPDFVLQGGVLTYDGTLRLVESFGPIVNEFDASRSNLRGTLAMAKLGGDPDSASSSFFFNLVNNDGSATPNNLDTLNGGFTVFGKVMGNGMDVVDLLSAQDFNFSDYYESALFNNFPLRDYTEYADYLADLAVYKAGPQIEPFTTDHSFGPGNLEMYNITIVEPLAGDFDADNDVDGVDFGIWQTGYPTASGATLADGDADGDGDVDGVDFGIWQTNYPTNLGSAATIPEPATLSLLLIGGLALLRRKSK